MRIKTIYLLAIIITLSYPATAQHELQNAYTLKENPAIIEGMTYDPIGKNFYFGESTSKHILRYTSAGRSAGFIDAAKDGMTSVLGMSVNTKTHHLWICGATDTGTNKMMCMFQYDLSNGKLVSKLPDTSGKAKLFNDVTITDDGSVFVTETYSRTLYTADPDNGVMTSYMEHDLLRDANGITSCGDTIYISTSRGIVRINTENKNITSIPLDEFMIAGIDGLYYYRNSLIGIQNVFFPVNIIRYYLDNKNQKISKAEILASGHPSFVIPTTGAIVNNDFYFMSNNNIGTEDASAPNKVNMKKVKPVKIARLALMN